MPDIHHTFPIHSSARKVFDCISSPKGLDAWWAKSSEGEPVVGNTYRLYFAPEYDWRAVVTTCEPEKHFEFLITEADEDWTQSKVGFILTEKDSTTLVEFYHTGWPKDNKHYSISSFCWAMYLRLLKRYIELGEIVAYENRLEV